MARTKRKPSGPTCDWLDDGEFWETGCGEAFQFTDAGPRENRFSFCPYCGCALKAERLALEEEFKKRIDILEARAKRAEATTPEQQARDMLERMGIDEGQSITTGDVVELANLIATSAQREALLTARAQEIEQVKAELLKLETKWDERAGTMTRPECQRYSISFEADPLGQVQEYADPNGEYYRCDEIDAYIRTLVAAPLPASAALQDWQTAALLKDRTRRAIRDRATAGESHADLATDYGVPLAFVQALCAWQFSADDAMQDWQPMETAPKDSQPIIVYDATYALPVVPAEWDNDKESEGGQCWRAADAQFDRLRPTHWMPLPDPPLAAALSRADQP